MKDVQTSERIEIESGWLRQTSLITGFFSDDSFHINFQINTFKNHIDLDQFCWETQVPYMLTFLYQSEDAFFDLFFYKIK